MTSRVSSLGATHRYRLDARIATGGMGEVWRATDTLLDREVAVKVLKSEYADDATFRSRFEAEARHAAALHHPNVASVFDFGEVDSDDGSGASCPFLVMELVPGQPLSALLQGGHHLPPEQAAHLIAQAADAIAAAHAMDIVHRDVKPANLLVTPEGEVKITDFGIARAGDATPLTQTGQIVGTPHYISPEQAEGRSATKASDVYALGVVLYECLAGHRPFAADTPVSTALAHVREQVPPLPEAVPLHLRQVVATALAKSPADRFASADELAAALRGRPVVRPLPLLAPAPETRLMALRTALSPRQLSALPAWVPLLGVAAGVFLLFGALAVFGGDRSAEANAPATPAATPRASGGEQLRVNAEHLVGMDAGRARERLEGRGFEVDQEKQENPGGHDEATVAAVTPHGLVDPSAEITLFVWEKEPGPVGDDARDSGEHEDEGGGEDERNGEDEGTGGEPKDDDKGGHGDPGSKDKGPSKQGMKNSDGKAGESKGKTG